MEAGLNRTKPLDELEEQKETLKRQIEEDKRVIADENASPSDREAAEARVEEREEELARFDPQIEEREEALPLRKRVKKYLQEIWLDTASGCSGCRLSHRCSYPCCNECPESRHKGYGKRT